VSSRPCILAEDEYALQEDGSAVCTRTYSFANNSTRAVDLSKGRYEELFHTDTSDHAIVDPAVGKKKLLCSDGYQFKVGHWSPSQAELKPGKKSSVVLRWNWPRFITVTDASHELKLGYRQPMKLTYTVKMTGCPDGYLDRVSFGDSTHGDVGLLHKEEGGAVSFGPIQLGTGVGAEFKLRLSVRSRLIDKSLPVLAHFAGQADQSCLEDYTVVMVQHLLSDFVPFVKALEGCGMKKRRCFIIGIPYSTKKYVVSALREMGYTHVESPAEYPFNDIVAKVLRKVVDTCIRENRRFLVVEDGGYVVPMLHTPEFSKSLKLCVGAVEQTSNGIWRDQELAKRCQLKIPVVSVAESKLKRDQEGKLIGRAVVANLERLLLSKYDDGVSGRDCMVIGLGSVGLNIARTLVADGANVHVTDADKKVLKQARRAGVHVATSVLGAIGRQTIVIGATGGRFGPPIGFEELLASPYNLVLVNASSRQQEVDDKQLKSLTVSKEKIRGFGTKYHLNTGKDVILVANGYPVNFFDSESVPDKEIQFIPTLLFCSAMLLCNPQAPLRRGTIHPVPDKLQKDIEQVHRKFREMPIA
jgi:S-adenosylhomocysteine hydrolase